MFIVFEGIDGSGKTTLSNRVAAALRDRGVGVAHVREGGKFVSSVTQAIRELGRDARNMAMVPRTELHLFLARDTQLLEEAILPALAEKQVVFADRFFYTAEVLAQHGRGLPADEVRPLVTAASRGVTPDLVVLVDVDPHVARARRRVAKVLQPDPRPSSRKGLAGVGMQHRLRDGYRQIAAREPERWIVVDNTDAPLDEQVAFLSSIVDTAMKDGVKAAIALARRSTGRSPTQPPPPSTTADATAAFLAWIDRRAAREPDVAAYFMTGLAGPGVDERREALVARSPELVAYGLRGLTDRVSWKLRAQLADSQPAWVARSLAALAGDGEEAWRLRRALLDRVPADVAASLDGRDDDPSWELRDRLIDVVPAGVIASLKRIASARSWTLREKWIASRGGETAVAASFELARTLCESLNGVDDERSWDLRKLVKDTAPVPYLASMGGLSSDRAWKQRGRFLDRAPKVVLRTIAGLDDDRAWDLRERAAMRVKEAIDSMIGLDGDRAWTLRDRCADVWPSTVVKSLGPLARGQRGTALVARQLGRYPGNVSLLKHAAAIELGADLAAVDGAE